MESEEIIRAYLLEPGDVFKLGQTYYVVRTLTKERIYYRYLYFAFTKKVIHGPLRYMGANSREKLILITNKNKQNEHQNRSCNFSQS